MPRIEVLTEVPGGDPETLLTERVPAEGLADEHYASQLVERLAWAVVDAARRERTLQG